MRVIAGKYRGKKLQEFSLSSTRPTLDRVKESLFSSIQFDLIGANVLDLFAGTGALGIESLSRGASNAEFVDSSMEAIKIINSNLKGIDAQFKVTKSDYMTYLNTALQQGKKYDIVLLDPPFDTDYGIKAIKFIVDNDMLSEDGIIIYERLYTADFDLAIEGFIVNSLETENVECQVYLPKFVYAPIKKGEVLGKAVYLQNEKVIGEKELLSQNDIAAVAPSKNGLWVILENVRYIFDNI